MDSPQALKPKVIHRKRPVGRPKDPILVSPRAQARADVKQRTRLVDGVLKLSHTRNGIVYGPGAVQLPRSLLLELQHNEEQAARVEEQFLGSKAAIIVSERGKIREVPPETFDASLASAEPAITQKGII